MTLFVSLERGDPLEHSGTRQGRMETLLSPLEQDDDQRDDSDVTNVTSRKYAGTYSRLRDEVVYLNEKNEPVGFLELLL
ncbi:unnamed protein product [Heligmosomoides polygyrus]|uniref:SLC12 domain-containing protein n=1 Tax=Heligmosomoides polygyrus TaxID=6339 RepID=A0A183F941_HELPZ|nr:unnamed protein product [Heligmosomoides polygyrus]